ncbi:cytochrome P450 [Mycena capillaripes]|nr:cytochrome P450 [Mycena capillaripes]
MSDLLTGCLYVLLSAGFWIVWHVLRSSRNIIDCIPGPESESWIYGNILQLLVSKEYGEHEFRWLETPTFVHGLAQQKAGNFSFGLGNVFLAQDERHRYLRNIMNPAFSAKSVRATLPALREIGSRLVEQWEAQGFPGNTVDISDSLQNAALDAMGSAILEHSFNALEGKSELAKIQRTLLDSISNATKFGQLADAILPYIPETLQDYQQALRKEIQLATLNATGDPDYDKMPRLNAIINEVLRFYSPLPLAERIAIEDCVLPLSQPLTTNTGAQISEIPIKKGQAFYIGIGSYHRLTSVWGSDAGVFRPSRWLEEDPCKGAALGPYASVLAFSAGPGVCLGWRFAILEIQVFVPELVRQFSLSLPENDSVRACIAVTMEARTADGFNHHHVFEFSSLKVDYVSLSVPQVVLRVDFDI